MKKALCLSFGIILFSTSENCVLAMHQQTHANQEQMYTNQEKREILVQIQEKVFPRGSSNYNLTQNLRLMLEQGLPWSEDDKMEFNNLLQKEGVQIVLQHFHSTLSGFSNAEHRLNEKQQQRVFELLGKQLSYKQQQILGEIAQMDTGMLLSEQQFKMLNELLSFGFADNEEAGNGLPSIFSEARFIGLPKPTSPQLEQLKQIVDQFFGVIEREGLDFDVHKFDPLFGNGEFFKNINSPNCQAIIRYLDTFIPEKESMTLDQIHEQMLRDFHECTPKSRSENDLSKDYLARAFQVLRTEQSHKNLINAFRQICTMIYRRTPEWQKDMLISFLSNVNKFKGRECYQGFRNRMFSMFCLIYGHLHGYRQLHFSNALR